MNEAWQFWLLSNESVFYAINVLIAANLACSAGLVAAKILQQRSMPLRYGVLRAALVSTVASLGLVYVAQQTGIGWVAVEIPDAMNLSRGETRSAGNSWAQSDPAAGDARAVDEVASGVVASAAPGAWIRSLVSLLAVVWAAGVFWHAGRLAWGSIRVARFRRSFTEPEDDVLLRAVDRAAAIVGLKQAPAVLLSSAAPTPLVVGLWRPAIVLPRDLCGDVSSDQLQALLLHETAHIAHGDQWMGLMQRLTELLFWPLPLVHMVSRRISAVREDICDNYVIRACGTGHGLAEVLVLLAERVAASPPLPATMGLFEAAEDGLPARVERLLRKERNTMTRMNLVSLLATGAFAVALGGATLAANVRLDDVAAVEENSLAKLPVLGQDREAVIQRCGKPLEEKTLGGEGGINWMRFQVGEFRLIVEIAPTTKKVIQIYHFRKTAYTDAEIAQLLEQNAQGKPWKPENKAEYHWKRSDGVTSRGDGPTLYDGQESKEWKFVVLDPSWRARP
jgi:beta-lactamase regulating signal transducer with metallopeptidase domain